VRSQSIIAVEGVKRTSSLHFGLFTLWCQSEMINIMHHVIVSYITSFVVSCMSPSSVLKEIRFTLDYSQFTVLLDLSRPIGATSTHHRNPAACCVTAPPDFQHVSS
jgi:hypothetical protein